MTADAAPAPTHAVRLNLGAGYQERSGWIAYDRTRAPVLSRWGPVRASVRLLQQAGVARESGVLRWPASTRIHDVTVGIPHADDSVDAIYTSHMLEHLTREQGELLFAECFRTLKPGGLLRVVVPDLVPAVRAYVDGDISYFRSRTQLLADAFSEALYAHAPPRGRAATALIRILRSDDGGHKWMYDETSLEERFTRAGFTNVERVGFREGRDPEAASLDTRSPHHIHMEASKPGGYR